MKQRILVTGGTGFIGSHTVVTLLKAGYEVVIIDNLSNSYLQVIDGIIKISGINPEFHKIDLVDEASVRNFFSANKPFDGIIHFAALKAVGESVKEPIKYYKNNVSSLINILENMDKFNIPNLVFSSSCTVYGQPEELPVTEKSPTKRPESPYGNTKKIGEELIEEVIYALSKLKAISLRYFNPIGAHYSGYIGELPQGIPNNLVPVVTQAAAGQRDKITVYGDNYNTHDGTCIRDYIHVSDLAEAHSIAIRRLFEGRNEERFEVFNLGTGNGSSVMDIINTFQDATGVKVPYEIGERREGDIEKIFADTQKANTELGWTPKEDLKSMLKSAWDWQQNVYSVYPELKKK